MANASRVFSAENLGRAWLWVLTNPEAHYKSYFRGLYRAYSLASEANLQDLRTRLLNKSYSPSHTIKVYFPKPSGLQRAYSLLSVEDQIVYQALVNFIGERLSRKMQSHYYTSVFGNLYAGSKSNYFFCDWRKGYTRFSKALRKAYESGLRYTATFDLTACYDSIDHSVLEHFLVRLGLGKEFCTDLTKLLKHWTAGSMENPIYQGHGIPQGPQSSGLLAEVVLHYFDEKMYADPTVKYFRYVDDIRLLAKTEMELRHALLRLDSLSRDIGLFPQTSKIKIHKVVSIDDEIKSISNPPEFDSLVEDPNQPAIRARLKQLSPKFMVTNETRFKFVLGHASPNAELAKRLLRILSRQPHLYQSIFRYLEKFSTFNKMLSSSILAVSAEYELYPAFSAAMLRVVCGRIDSAIEPELKKRCLALSSGGISNVNLYVAMTKVLLHYDWIAVAKVPRQSTWKNNWWVRAELLPHLRPILVGQNMFYKLVNHSLRDNSNDVARVAAELAVIHSIPVEKPYEELNSSSLSVLRETGLIGLRRSSRCPVSIAMVDVLGCAVKSIKWRKILGRDYRRMLQFVVGWRGYSSSDPSAWVNNTDTMNDLLLKRLFEHDPTIGGYTYGSIGSVLHTSTSRFAKKYPDLFAATSAFHKRRLECALSHPFVKSSGKKTRYIAFKELKRLKRILCKGYLELARLW